MAALSQQWVLDVTTSPGIKSAASWHVHKILHQVTLDFHNRYFLSSRV